MVSSSSRKAKILLIDDDPAMVRLLTKFVERAFGDRTLIESLTDPREARARLNESVVDILITDLEMPGISGLELLRSAKRRNAFTQVLFITGQSSQDALLDALELGATDYLLKPVEHDGFLELIEQALLRHQRWRVALSETWREPVAKVKDFL